MHTGNRDIQPAGAGALIQWVEPTVEVGLFAFGAADFLNIDCMNPCIALSVRAQATAKVIEIKQL